MKGTIIATEAEVRERGRVIKQIQGMEIGIFWLDGQFYAWRNVCPHAAAPVCEGVVCGTRLPSLVYDYEYGMDAQVLRCPWHGWEFDLKTGQHLASTRFKLKGYALESDGEHLYIQLSSK